MAKLDALGQFEQLVLVAINSLEDAYGVTIRNKVEELYGRAVKFGSIYITLARLEEKGYVTSWFTEPIAERGGRAKRCYRLERAGKTALRESVATAHRMLDAIKEGGTI